MRVIFVFPVHADFSGLFHFFSAVWTLGTLWSSCLSDSFCWEIHCTFCLACAALNYLSILPLAEKKLHLSSAPSPLGKTSINIDLLLPLGACPFWCLLLSLIGSYSSKSCQESLEFFPRCVFSRMPRKSWVLFSSLADSPTSTVFPFLPPLCSLWISCVTGLSHCLATLGPTQVPRTKSC